MLSPIDWYDKSLSRDNEHDTMQMEIWHWLKAQPGLAAHTRDLLFEVPIVPLSGVGSDSLEVPAFADIAELYYPDDTAQTPRYILYVMKPRILTISGIVRQCRALEHAVTEMYRATATPMDGTAARKPIAGAPPPGLSIFAIVPEGDYRAPDLAEICPCLFWDSTANALLGDRFADVSSYQHSMPRGEA